jgi:signal transduction histidine kinase
MDSWRIKHGVVLLFLALYISMLIFVGLANFSARNNVLTVILSTSLYAMLATSEKVTQPLRQGLAVLGLATASSGLIYLSGGRILSHFSFAFALILSLIYQEKITYLVLLLYITFYYFVFAYINPLIVFDSLEIGKETFKWSIILYFITIISSLPALIHNYLSNVNANEQIQITSLLSQASLRERQAIEIHDNIVQELVYTKYLLELGDIDKVASQLDKTLDSSKKIVDELSKSKGVSTVRDTYSSKENEKEKLKKRNDTP